MGGNRIILVHNQKEEVEKGEVQNMIKRESGWEDVEESKEKERRLGKIGY